MEPLRVAIVGLGSIAQYHLRAFAQLDESSLYAVMSRDPQEAKRVAEQYGVDRVYHQYDQLLADPEVSAVILCTPSATHYPMARQALEANKHVMVEKPLADNLQQAQDLTELAARQHRTLMVAMTARFTPPYLKAHHLIQQGTIGKPIQIVIRWFENKSIGVNWKKQPVAVDSRTSTVLYHHGSHMLDAALWLADDTAQTIHVIGARRQQLLDDVAVTIKTTSGVLISSVHSFNAFKKIHDLVVIGADGMIEIEGYHRLTVNDCVKIDIDWEQGFICGVQVQAKEFVRCIQTQRVPITTSGNVLPLYQVLESAQAALELQGLM